MPGNAGSPFWATVDFDSEGSDVPSPPPNHRVYLDPWDNDAYMQERTESSQGENFNSFAGEPVSASFYYVPTKNYDSGEEPPLPPPRRKSFRVTEEVMQEPIYVGRKSSKIAVPDYPDAPIYGEKPARDRRRSMYIEEPIYVPHQMIYEPIYGPMVPPGYMPPPVPRMSVGHHPDYVMATLPHPQSRRQSRMMEAYEQFAYESLSPEYEDWARPYPKAVPDNFHLSRYGHLRIDYSCSWNSLDRLIRNQ